MSRPLRIEIENGLYHVTARGWERRRIVADDRDREDWLRLFDRVATRSGWRVFAWVLMDNHFHLFVRTPEPNLSAGMHDLNSGFASLFNRRHRRVGALFQGRFKAILVENRTHAWELSRYLHLNAVRANIVDLPESYRWSSYAAYRYAKHADNAPVWLDWETVLSEHSRDMRNARRAYRRFIEAGIDDPPQSPVDRADAGCLLGRWAWVEEMRAQLADDAEDRNVPQRRRLAWRPTPAAIVKTVRAHFRVADTDMHDVRRHGNDARTAAVYLIRRLTNERVSSLAEQFGGVSPAAISKLIARAEARRNDDPQWHRLLIRLEQRHQRRPKS